MAETAGKPRNAEGQFVSGDTDPFTTTKTILETSGPVNIITKPPKDNFDEPLVSVKIQNPFKKILHWLNDIRKKQTTTFDFKIKIPLLALPIFFAVLGGTFQFFFALGQAQEKKEIVTKPTPTPIVIMQPTAIPAPVVVSRMGTIKATYQVESLLPSPIPTIAPTDTQSSSSAIASPQAGTPTQIPPSPTPAPSRFVLVKGEGITFLIVPPEVSLNYYLNRRVLITGLYDKMTDTLKISKTNDIEILQ